MRNVRPYSTKAGLHVDVHALAETFSTLTGGHVAPQVSASQAATLIEAGILPFVSAAGLSTRDYLAAMKEAEKRGVRGGAIHDFLLSYCEASSRQALFPHHVCDLVKMDICSDDRRGKQRALFPSRWCELSLLVEMDREDAWCYGGARAACLLALVGRRQRIRLARAYLPDRGRRLARRILD